MNDLSDDDRDARIALAAMTELLAPQTGWYWLSFVDPALPEGSKFLGVAIVEADGPISAVTRTHELSINPGGEVMITGSISAGAIEAYVPVTHRDRLLSKAEAEEVGGDAEEEG